jgi:CheY-like chemotaxis protein
VILVLTDLAGNAMGASGQLDRIDAALSLPVSALALRTAVRSSLQRRAGFEPQPVTPVAPRLAGLRILVVDDSDINLEVAKRILVGEGARVDCASDGAQALIWLQLRSGDVDIVLMDVQMPAMDGYQTTRKIRELPALARIPVVALTAGVSDAHRDEAAAAGMNDFVTKPFDVEQIVSLILTLTGRDTSTLRLPMQDKPTDRSTDMPQARLAMDIERAVSIWKDAGVYRKFLRKFARDYRLCVSEMRSGDVVAAKARAHKLRGAAGSLVLGGIVQATQELEQCLASGANPDPAYAGLQGAFDVALAQIQVYAGSDPGDTQDAPPPGLTDPARLRALLQSALLKLEEDSPSLVEPVLADLTAMLGVADLMALRSALENYQFDACKREVRALAARHHITLET